MSVADPRIDRLLNALKAAGKSSPADWHRFHEFLKARKQSGHKDPPVPLILAASGESNATKHSRLSSQLQWALENDCLDDALRYLENVPVEQWNSCSLEQWNQENYPKPDGTYGPTYLEWNFEPKPKMSAESVAKAMEKLRSNWDDIAGPELRGVTSPLRFEGVKGRRLVVFAKIEASPPWGTWTALDQGTNRRCFTRFRTAVNAAIYPVEVDHIDFVHELSKTPP